MTNGKDMIRWLEFYVPYFDSTALADAFVRECESSGNQRAMLIMHQAARLVRIVQGMAMATIRPGRDALELLLLLTAAENISKLEASAKGGTQSRQHAQRFFKEFVSESDQATLTDGFASVPDRNPLSLKQIVDLLYDVRSDVVYEGRYWGFSFSLSGDFAPGADTPIACRLALDAFRNIIVRGAIAAAKRALATPVKEKKSAARAS